MAAFWSGAGTVVDVAVAVAALLLPSGMVEVGDMASFYWIGDFMMRDS